jgi:VanZ family protein
MTFFGNENFWLYLPLIAWIGGIFYFSSSRGSVTNASVYYVPVLNFLFPRDDAHSFKKHHLIVRKLAHFASYAILAFLASIAFYNSSLLFPAKFWYVCAFAVVLVTASTDEIRQSFYPERLGSVSDVVLDCGGGLTMIFLFWIFAANRF